jgi:perosamine synthetase
VSPHQVIPVSEPSLGAAERDALVACIDSGWISSEGPEVLSFEREMAAFAGRRYGIAVSSGTAALDVAVAALDIGVGDEVIVPTFTIISCVLQVVRSGATPVFVDADPLTWNIDVEAVESRVTQRTRALLVPHIYGLPAEMSRLLEIAERHGLVLIEDAAEAHGLHYQGQPCGSFGTVSTFSFYSNKLITTGEGGMVVTDDEGLAERCRSLRNLSFAPGRRFVHHELGWNYRMTNMQASLGRAQLSRIESLLLRKRQIALRYLDLLEGTEGLQLPLKSVGENESVFWVFGLVLAETSGRHAEDVMLDLATAGIGSRPFFYPLHRQPVLRQRGFGLLDRLPVAERIAEQGFYIPSGPTLTDAEIERVALAVRRSVEERPQ